MEVGVARGRRVNSHEYEERSIPGVLQSPVIGCNLSPTVHKAKKELPTRSRVKDCLFVGENNIY